MDTIVAKKSLGQNFLQDKKALKKIIDAAQLSSEGNVLEIGPGTGIVTKQLLKFAGQVIAIEKDSQLVDYLKSQSQFSKLKIINDDVLKINLPKLIKEEKFLEYKVVANIPYYITGQIIRLLLETKYPPTMMVLLVQKEVAQRICATPGDMSILAVSVQYYGKPEIIGIVPRESFYPAPEVDSAILKVILHSREISEAKYTFSNKEFFHLVRIGFSSRRKTLINNLSAGLKKEKKEIEKMFQTIGIHTNARAQELAINDWKALCQALSNMKDNTNAYLLNNRVAH